MERERTVRALLAEVDRYLSGFDGRGIAEVRRGIGDFRHGPLSGLTAKPDPSRGGFDAALAAARDAEGLIAAIAAARSHLQWVTYDGYPPDEIGPRFPEAHGFASLIGPEGLIEAEDFELGLFLIAPDTLYRDHHHAAPELYVPLTGPHQWRFGTAAPWEERSAHQPVWNEPWAAHATIIGPVPFLCIFSWTRDVVLPAKVVPAKDWAEIEAGLERQRV